MKVQLQLSSYIDKAGVKVKDEAVAGSPAQLSSNNKLGLIGRAAAEIHDVSRVVRLFPRGS